MRNLRDKITLHGRMKQRLMTPKIWNAVFDELRLFSSLVSCLLLKGQTLGWTLFLLLEKHSLKKNSPVRDYFCFEYKNKRIHLPGVFSLAENPSPRYKTYLGFLEWNVPWIDNHNPKAESNPNIYPGLFPNPGPNINNQPICNQTNLRLINWWTVRNRSSLRGGGV